jgi:hypothetical protein
MVNSTISLPVGKVVVEAPASGKIGSPAETHANLGGLGMGSYKPFGILVEGWGEGWRARARLSPESP